MIRSERLDSIQISLVDDPAQTDPTFKITDETMVGAVLSFDETIYDAAGRVDHTVQSDGTQWLISKSIYDAADRVTSSIQDLDGDLSTPGDQLVTNYVYDQAGRQTRVIDALGHEMRYEYDKLGRQVAVILPNVIDPVTGAVVHDHLRTETVYDALGRRIKSIENITQETPGNAATIDRTGQRTTDYEYDDAGRLTAVVLPEVLDAETGLPTRPRYEYEYDQYGNQKIIRDPKGHETTFKYDEQQRQVSRELPDALTETMHYNDTPLSSLSNPASSVGLGQIEYSVDFQGRVTAYRYDNTANGDGRTVGTYYYTALAAYTGDASDGTLNSAAETVTYNYDALGRAVETNDSNFTVATTQAYDTFGRLTQIASPQGIINYGYNNLGQKTRTWTSKGTSGTDLNDAITDTLYTYDVLGRLKTVQAVERNDVAVTESATEFRYDNNGNLAQTELPNGVIQDYLYDELNRLVRLRHFNDANANDLFDAGEAVLAEFDYTLADDGKRSHVLETDDAGRQTVLDWVYDDLGRLTEERYNAEGTDYDFIARYSFDLASNRVKMEKDTNNADPVDFLVAETTTYTYDVNDRLTQEIFDATDPANDTNGRYTYSGTEQTGNTVRAGSAIDEGTLKSQTNYGFNVQGRLASVATDSDGNGITDQSFTYKYNADGIRVEQTEQIGTNPAVTTIFHVDPNNSTGYAQVIEEGVDANADGRLQSTEVGKSYTLGLDVIGQQGASGQIYYLVYDGHGSTRAVVTPNLSVSQRYAYEAYGGLLPGVLLTSNIASAFTSLLYSGERRDKTGLDYLRGRYLDPRTGRFISFDAYAGNTHDPLSLHKYLYTHGDPIMANDPTGMFEGLVGVAVGNSIGSIISQMNVEVGQSILNSLGVDETLDLAQRIGSWVWDHLPEGVQDSIEAAYDFVVEHFDEVAVVASFATVGLAVNYRQRYLFDYVANHAAELGATDSAARHRLARAVAGAGGEAHHIIPWEEKIRAHTIVERAARGGFNINGANNGIRLGAAQHFGSHDKYNTAVLRKLDAILADNPNISELDAAAVLQQFADQLRAGLERSNKLLH